MKARIIETKSELFPIDFNGKRYYTNLSMAACKEIAEKYAGGVFDALSNIEKLEVAADIVAAVINNAIRIKNFENDENEKLLTAEYISLVSDYSAFAQYIKQLLPMIKHSFPAANITGTELTGEDEDIDDSDVPEVEKN